MNKEINLQQQETHYIAAALLIPSVYSSYKAIALMSLGVLPASYAWIQAKGWLGVARFRLEMAMKGQDNRLIIYYRDLCLEHGINLFNSEEIMKQRMPDMLLKTIGTLVLLSLNFESSCSGDQLFLENLSSLVCGVTGYLCSDQES